MAIYCHLPLIWHKNGCLSQVQIIHSNTVKPVLSGHAKIDKTKILMTNGSLMKLIGAFCNTFDLH